MGSENRKYEDNQTMKEAVEKKKKIGLFRNRKFYTVLLILSTMILCADLALHFLAPGAGAKDRENFQRPEFSADGDSMGANGGKTGRPESSSETAGNSAENDSEADLNNEREDGSSESGEDDSQNGETLEAFNPDKGTMKEMPEDGKPPEGMPEDGELPEDFDPSNQEGFNGDRNGSMKNRPGGIWMTFQRVWIPILVVCIFIDVFSIFMLIYLSKKKREMKMNCRNSEERDPETEEQERKKRRSVKWKGPMALILAIVCALYFLPANVSSGWSRQAVRVLKEDTVKKQDITTYLTGGGSISDADPMNVEIPDQVEIESYSVGNGSKVEKGDTLAVVNMASVKTAIAELQESMAQLDEKLEKLNDEEEGEEDSGEITAGTEGRVKVIYAEEGEKVVDTIYQNGALLVVSLDGKMALVIETEEDCKEGEVVQVLLSDGSEEEGRINEVRDGSVIVTLSDENADLGDTAKVYLNNKKLGSGTLYIHIAQKVTGISGKVTEICVEENEKISVDQTLLKLTDVDYQAERVSLLAQRQEMEDQMADLVCLQQDPCIYAKEAGIVTGVDEEMVVEKESSVTTSSEASLKSKTVSGSTVNLTADKTVRSGSTVNLTVVKTVESGSGENLSVKTMAYSVNGNQSAQSIAAEGEKTEEPAAVFGARVTAVSKNSLEILRTAETITISENTKLSDLEDQMTEKVIWNVPENVKVYVNTGENGTAAEWKTISISEIRKGDYLAFGFDSEENLLWVICQHNSDTEGDYPGESPSGDETESSKSEEGNEPGESDSSGENFPGENPEDNPGNNPGQRPSDGETENSMETIPSGENNQDGKNGQGTDMGGNGMNGNGVNGYGNLVSGQMGSMGNFSDIGDGIMAAGTVGIKEEESSYVPAVKSICGIIPTEKVTIDISVDELDILQISLGQEAVITLDAMEGQEFTGVVTGIDQTGTNAGGSTKYTVELTMDREENMLAGMNAVVNFSLETAEQVLAVPEEALVEDGTKVYVYTAYDEENDTLSSPVEVITGVSDGTNVEICQGLEEGDSYCYKYADTVTYSVP